MPYLDAATRRPQLVAAARRAMTRHGVGSTSMRVVAAEAGVPLGTLQHAFPTKELLFRAVFDDVVGEMEALGDGGVDLGAGVAVAVRSGLAAFWSQLVRPDVGSHLMQLELLADAARSRADEGLAAWLYERYLAVATDLFERAAAAAGETCARPAEQLARLLVAGLDGLLVQYVCSPDDTRADADLDLLADMVVHAAGI